MSIIARNFGATVIKNAGDSVLFYFPRTMIKTEVKETSQLDAGNSNLEYRAFRNVLDCLAAMKDANKHVGTRLSQEGLPAVKYRISADYGEAELARSTTSREDDLFGSTVTLCVKINSMAKSNGIVIGDNLYRIVKSLGGYGFVQAGTFRCGPYFAYKVYHLNKTVRDTREPFREFSRAIWAEHKEELRNKKHAANIMLVDDDPWVLTTFKTFLKGRCNVYAFRNGEEALRNIAAVGPEFYSLVISDIRMSPINGLELYRRIKGINPNLQVMFITALDATEEFLSILPGIRRSNILRKPVSKDLFLKSVEELVQVTSLPV
jgi:CheY-like chemotaxis protein/class 3 adenylate cyclase